MNERKKGNSLIAFPKDYVVVDIETTGLVPEYDSIIEIGAIKVRDDKIVDKFSTLINAPVLLDDFIVQLTGITEGMLDSAPKADAVMRDFISFIGGDIMLGHNIPFDINFLYDACLSLCNVHLVNDFIDTRRLARKVLPDIDKYRLKDLVEHFNVPMQKSHRAFDDCNATFEVYKNLKSEIVSGIGIDEFLKSNKVSHAKIDLTKITANITDPAIVKETQIYGKYCVFTGKLERYTRAEAAQIVTNLGGFCENNITKNTNFLILGNDDYCSSVKDGKSTKHKKAESYILKGYDLQIISENVFYEYLGI